MEWMSIKVLSINEAKYH